ncbi:hypothetical protein HanRHA438_Chr10g0441791 [Helianthus annuus]|uniref:Uncharacterized protein n=1 Tax=Helianthus annuus TaxID=4232 RepID=A0A251TGY8_HELAN|nr:uncharacterized protein LOC110884472 [Helianthus annuus]KAF5785501.1 hypothetical protein HanXRQr2_Chr10g0429391 [Helianthus annuus]KAJ0513048.1 hypothetical protein HanHA300_Chr10g0353051 [Helianthus annuus]KAJ0520776.1 hypothetical protein HanIR_Chr10g0463161 [Helianthus annuus]KAJ0529171.1 hypothetical protein HanHA89_Chr10g0374731 [Helianthus annuus]KAJ0696053.1 hypothetical protein HanLR1_Chr10g0352571 [Helianthus annuus]
MEDSSMINMPDLVFEEKVGNKRVRDGEEEIHKGRLEKRPSGVLGVNGGGDHIVDEGDQGGESGGIIDTFISNVFHNNTSGIEGEVEANVFDVVEDENKREDLGRVDGGDGGGEGGEGGGGGIISAFFSDIFHQNGSANEDGDQAKSDHLLDEVAEKSEHLGGEDGGNGEPVDLNAEKLPEKKDQVVDLPSKDSKGPTPNLKPDDYAERVFFLNNN